MSFNIHKYQDYCKYEPLMRCDIDIKELVERLSTVYNIEEFIGSGDYGIAFKCSGDKVLKITTDISETYFANIICNKEFDNLCHVYDVKSYTPKVHIISYQRVSQIKDINEIQFLSNFYHYYMRNYNDKLPPLDKVDLFFRKYETSHLSKRYKWMLNQLEKIFQQCNSIDMRFVDCHQDNLGYNNKGNLVLFDIGNQYGNYNIKDIETISL